MQCYLQALGIKQVRYNLQVLVFCRFPGSWELFQTAYVDIEIAQIGQLCIYVDFLPISIST